MIIVSFYTSLYEEQQYILRSSLDKFNLKYDIQKIASRGSWKANCVYRSQFLINMMNKYNDDVVWLDADAEVLQHPSLLYEISSETDLAWYNREGNEFMLGTSYWKNSPLVKHLLMDWVANCDVSSSNLSQKDFMKLFQQKYAGKFIVQTLPESYCHIFDKPEQEPAVIIHHQLSRKTKNAPPEKREEPLSYNYKKKVQTPTPETTADPSFPIYRITNPLGRKTVFLSLNQANWAFDVRCTSLEKLLSPYFNIKKVSGFDVARKGIGFHADLVYWPTYESLDMMGSHCHRVCATIGGLVIRSLEESISHFGKAAAIAVPNKTWFKQYQEKNLPVKFFYIPNGVDISLFVPKPKAHDEFIVGWAGNDRPDRAKVKRIEELRAICNKRGIILLEQGRSSIVVHDKMPAFYQKLDLYVNLSITEGSNNCILEAAACGIPILGTKVGNIPELERVGAFTVEHDLNDLEEKLVYIQSLKNRRDVGDSLRNEVVINYSSELMAMRYKEMFDFCLSKDIK
jgi:glycosyltransferase involved in cell wall biosynthesis